MTLQADISGAYLSVPYFREQGNLQARAGKFVALAGNYPIAGAVQAQRHQLAILPDVRMPSEVRRLVDIPWRRRCKATDDDN